MLKGRTLVTGARGYLGGRLVQHLAGQGTSVIGATRYVPVKPTGWPDAVPLVKLNPTDDPVLNRESLTGIDCVVHLAAANEWRSVSDPDAALFETGAGTRRLLESAISAGVRRFVFLSTVHVYGAPLLGDLSETSLPHPIHPYAITHLVGEAFTHAAHAAGRIHGTVVRLSNGIGAPAWTDVDRWTLVGNDFARQIVETGEINVKAPDQWRDFITLGDVCRGLEILSGAPEEQTAGLFNLASGSAIKIRTVAERMAVIAADLLGQHVPVRQSAECLGNNVAPLRIINERVRGLGFVPCSDAEFDRELRTTIELLVHRGAKISVRHPS